MKRLFVGVAVAGTREGMCKMVAGASVDCLALYDTQAERSICFSICCSARCGLIYLTCHAAMELGKDVQHNRHVWLSRSYNNSDCS